MPDDLRHAWRAVRAMPFVSAVIVASLAIGIGVNAAVFSWVEAAMLRPLPGVPDSGAYQLVEARAGTGSYPGTSWLEYRDLQDSLQSFRGLIAARMVALTVGDAGRVERSYAQLVSGNYFGVLRLKPAAGRFIEPRDAERPGAEPVVVLSFAYWTTRYGGNPAAVGQSIRVNGRVLTVVGVAPARFQGTVFGLSFDMWVPATLAPALWPATRELEDRSIRGYSVMGPLRPRAGRAQAQSELTAAMGRLARTYPLVNRAITGEVLPFWQAPRGPQRLLANALVTLQGILLVLLLAVCGNTANLLLARATARQREIGMRLALGAAPWRVTSLMLSETLLLAGVSAVLGVAIAAWATDALRAVPMITTFPIRFETEIDGLALAFAVILGVACGVLSGIVPALHLMRIDPQSAIRSGARSAGRSRLRNTLMAVEVALAMMVLTAAALFYRSFAESRDANPGFRREGVLLAAYDLSNRDDGAPQASDFAARLLDRLRAAPGVEAAAIASSVPLDIHGLPTRAFTIEGRARNAAAPDEALSNVVTPDYFRVMDIPFRAGRDFVDLRDGSSPAQAIVNEEFVRRFVVGRENVAALGRRIDVRGRAYLIAGVVRNSISDSFGEPPAPVVYFSYRDRPSLQGEIHLRTRPGAEAQLAPQIDRAVHAIDPTLPVYAVRTLGDHIERNLFLTRIPARLFVVLGPLLLALAAIGIYAVVSYTVARRTVEIGVRLTLGATRPRVVAQIVGESLRLVAVGAMAGWLVALAADLQIVDGPPHWAVFVAVPVVLISIAAYACWLPAWRAAARNPMDALRQE